MCTKGNVLTKREQKWRNIKVITLMKHDIANAKQQSFAVKRQNAIRISKCVHKKKVKKKT